MNLCRLGVGVIYPTFKSFEAIESPGAKDDQQWLTYWVVYSFINIVEKLLWVVLMWVPLYGLLKTALLAWLAVPQFYGAKVLYTIFIKDALRMAANQLKDIPALESIVKPFIDAQVTAQQKKEDAPAAADVPAVHAAAPSS